MEQRYIFVNDYQYLSEWEKLSFTLFGDEINEMDRFIEFNKEMFKESYAVENKHPDLLTKSNLDFIKCVLQDGTNLLEDMDQNTMMLINQDEHKSGIVPPSPNLLRYRGNRIDFNHIWQFRHFDHTQVFVKNRLFYSPCVYPNVMDDLSFNNLLELAEERYPERRVKFLDHFKEENPIVMDRCKSNDVFMIVMDYIQPCKFIRKN